MDRIKLGYAPTRRSIFSAPDARKYRDLTAERLRELEIDFVDITFRNRFYRTLANARTASHTVVINYVSHCF